MKPKNPRDVQQPVITSTVTVPEPPPEPAPEEYPEIESLALVRSPKGWFVVLLTTQGDRVTDREMLTDPEPKAIAGERFKIECVRRVLVPVARGLRV